MSPEERRRRLQQILDRHDEIAARLRESREHAEIHSARLDATAAYVRAITDEVFAMSARLRDSNAAVNEATTAMIAANRAALALFNDDEDGGRS